jgi:hypothetical protein
MNHGLVIIGDALEPRIWQMAMDQGRFVAVYTEKFRSEWESTYVRPSAGESLMVNPMPMDLLSIDSLPYKLASRHEPDYLEYARYEPQYDQQFLRMCSNININRHLAIVVPSTTSDEEPMRLLHVLYSLLWPLEERYTNLYGKRKKSERRLRDVLMPIRLEEAWVYCLGVVGKGYTNVFLSKDCVDEKWIEEINTDKYEPEVIEKW